MRRTIIASVAVVLVAALLGGCEVTMTMPKHFAPVEEPRRFARQSVSADGVVLSCRSEENPPRGTLDFWSETIDNHFKSRNNYRLTSRANITSTTGTPGKLMAFDTTVRGMAHKYRVAIYIKGKRVLIGEAGGPARAMDHHHKAVTASLLSVR